MHPFCSPDDLAIAETIRRFVSDEIAPTAAATDKEELFAGRHLPALAEMGLTGMNLPEHWGGAGISPVGLYLAVEALAAGCASTASMLTAHFLATDSILIGGNDAQRARWLPPAAAGQSLGAFALTEPAAGSNPVDMKSRARRDGDDYVLNGTKHFISNAGHADFLVLYTMTAPEAGAKGISAFIVPRGTPGMDIGTNEPTMGLRGGHVFEVRFEECRIPAENRLGEEGSGFRIALKVLDNGRIEVTATSTGIATAALELARNYMLEREVSGKPIARFQGLQWSLADMATDLEAARVLGLRAASLRATGARFSREAAIAKLFAAEAAGRITDGALQIFGGVGYTRDFPLERLVRDARIMRIYEGSSEVQRNIIARDLLN